MSNIPNAAKGGTDKMHTDEPDLDDLKPWRDDAAWGEPAKSAEAKPAWTTMPSDPSLGFYKNHDEKRADEARTSKLVEDMRRMEEAKAEQARLKAGVSLTPPPTDPNHIVLEWAVPKDTSSLAMEYLYDPFLPARCVVGFFGRGSTAKSSFLATLAAMKSDDWSTLWISVEELRDWITQRHLAAGGAVGTLAVFAHKAVKQDAQGRAIGSTFDVFRDLQGAIAQAKATSAGAYIPPRPLRLVVLDTAVGLTTWAKGESANDDGAVKRLLSHLQALAEQHDLCIAIIGHSNKGKHDYFADTVAGSSAWTNSPRLSFVHARDRREEHSYVVRVREAKTAAEKHFVMQSA